MTFFGNFKNCDVLFLADIKGFTARKIYKFLDDKIIISEKRISDNKVFFNNLTGIEAVKTLYREKKRIISVIPDVTYDNLYGWVYGVNKEIKNKRGKIVQIRQYASDFSGKKKLIKKTFITT